MFTYTLLARKPAAFVSLTGMTVAGFDALHDEFVSAQAARRAAATRTARYGTPRLRAPGAGRPHDRNDRDRLRIALFWLKVYPTDEVLGFFFGLHKGNARRDVRDVLATLATLADFPFDHPPGSRTRLGSVAAVMEAFPQVRVVIDSREQKVERPKGYDRQKPFYSGKKKCHTIKAQIAVTPEGRIASVSESVPGTTHDAASLRQTGLLHRLDTAAGEGGMMDRGYDGITKDHPGHDLVLPHPARRAHPLTEEQKAANQVIARHRIVVEHAMAQLSRYGAVRQVFRSPLVVHSRVVRVVALLVDRRSAVKPLRAWTAA
jgi:DDE superfamily endonuclease